MNSTSKELAAELPGLIRIYKDGTAERLIDFPHVPPSLIPDPDTGVSSKDVIISQNPPISARLYLPKLTPNSNWKIPILVYFHGGGFCIGSTFSSLDHNYLSLLVSKSGFIIVSIEYRLAPENPLPAAYEDCWAGLQWVASHSHSISENPNPKIESDQWLLNHGDLGKIFIGGDSAGGNIAHNVAIRAGIEDLNGGVKVFGAFFGQPFFWGSEPIGSEPTIDLENNWAVKFWNVAYPAAPGGIDNPMINPVGGSGGKAKLAALGCSKVLIYVAEKDALRDRGVWYYDGVKESGWGGKVELFEMKGEDHIFHFLYPDSENAKTMMDKLVSFLVSPY